jgi:UDP-2,3-diacylglucosamine pyrophosphatase LpxH
MHLGSDLSRASELLRLLKSRKWTLVIIVGDAFCDLNFSRLKRVHFLVLNYLRKLSKPKRGCKVVWVEGNHDAGLINVMSHIVGAKCYMEYAWEWCGKKCLAIHGHQFDMIVSKNPALVRLASFLFLEMQKFSWLRRTFAMLIDKNLGKWQRLTPLVQEGALAYAARGGYDFVFCGHTHEALHSEQDGIHYFNTGCWLGEEMDYVVLDDDEAILHKFVEPVKKRDLQIISA